MEPVAATAAHPPIPGATVPALKISRAGSRTVHDGPAQTFSGAVRIERLFAPAGPDRAGASSVTFSPGARTAWHTHPLGQTLIVTDGVGRVQRWDGPVETMRAGDVVRIAPGVKHWHGAATDCAMTHLAIQEALDGKSADWMEHVSDGQGQAAPTA